MMFTGSPPGLPGERVQLFFLADDAREAVGRGNPIYIVAVHYDALLHRLLPLEPVASRPGWTLPASREPNGSVAIDGSIPRPSPLTPDPPRGRSPRPDRG